MPEARPAQPAHAARARTNAPLSLSPDAQAPAKPETRVASVGPTSLAPAAAPAAAKGAYAVQVSSQRSEQEAQAAFHALQGKYPTQLGGKPMFVHKVELGAKGTYYRALVGPFASSSEAVSLCTSLKSAGGSCFIQRN
jgi:cell division septation protein DedD